MTAIRLHFGTARPRWRMDRRLALVACLSLSLLAVGCDAAPPPPADGGVVDAGSDDGGAVVDAGALGDGGASRDAGIADDDAAVDAGAPDAGCAPVPCEPPPGCRYEGGGECDCGALVCEPPPPSGCEPSCGAGTFCDLCAASPACAPRPMDRGAVCPSIYMPVCGCDGVTYSNACALGSAGIARLHDGECGVTPPRVVCDGALCGPGEYCDHTDACGGPGTCTVFDPGAVCDAVEAPVCGCDGTTYANACEASRAGADVDHDGPCAPPPGGCTTDADCPPTSTCSACLTPSGVALTCIPVGAAC